MTVESEAGLFLDGPAALVLVSSEVAAEPTPIWDRALLTDAGRAFLQLRLRDYWTYGPGSAPIEWTVPDFPEWYPGASVICPACARVIGARRDWSPVRHKAGGEWCAPEAPGIPVK